MQVCSVANRKGFVEIEVAVTNCLDQGSLRYNLLGIVIRDEIAVPVCTAFTLCIQASTTCLPLVYETDPQQKQSACHSIEGRQKFSDLKNRFEGFRGISWVRNRLN